MHSQNPDVSRTTEDYFSHRRVSAR